MPIQKASDVVRVHVHDDGDTELQKHVYSPLLTLTYPGDLFYNMGEINKGKLEAELKTYGISDTNIHTAIRDVLMGDYWTPVEVK